MKTNRLILFTLLFVEMGMTGHSQEANQENPRGAYKLIDFVGRDGSTFKPVEEQYKICTDSMTLTLNVKGDKFDFSIRKGDGIFDYTGEEPDVYDPHAPRIYDSNAQRFSFKWWSEGYLDRPLFPTKDWCIEHYEAGKFSEAGKAIIDAFMSPDYRDESNPLIGVWCSRGTVKNIQETEEVKRVLHAPQKKTSSYSVLTPSKLLNIVARTGQIIPVRVINKDSLQMGSSMRAVTWLSQDTIAIALQQGYVVWTRALIEKPIQHIDSTSICRSLPDSVMIPPNCMSLFGGRKVFYYAPFVSLDTNEFYDTQGILDAAELAIAHRKGCLWAREGQDSISYEISQKDFFKKCQQGYYKILFEYRDSMLSEIVNKEFFGQVAEKRREKGVPRKVTNPVYSLLLEFDICKRKARNIFLSQKKAELKAKQYVSSHYHIMSDDEILEKYQKEYNSLWKMNNTMAERARIQDEQLLLFLDKDISEISPDFIEFVIEYLKNCGVDAEGVWQRIDNSNYLRQLRKYEFSRFVEEYDLSEKFAR